MGFFYISILYRGPWQKGRYPTEIRVHLAVIESTDWGTKDWAVIIDQWPFKAVYWHQMLMIRQPGLDRLVGIIDVCCFAGSLWWPAE